MDEITQLGEQTRTFFEHHVPPEVAMPLFIAMPIAFIIVGLGLAVLGAKMAKPALTIAFTVGGAVGGGLLLGRALGVTPGIGMLLGALVCGVTGFMLHRLWVGMAAAVLISALAGGGYGAQSLVPALRAYNAELPRMTTAVVAPAAAKNTSADAEKFTLPDSDGETEVFSAEFTQWIADIGDWGCGFWEYASAGDDRLSRYLPIVAVAGGLFGLVLGLLAPRLTMIGVTSVFGIALVTSGATALGQRFDPGLYRAAVANPQAIGMACGALLLGSLILQTLLTRSDKTRAKKPEKS